MTTAVRTPREVTRRLSKQILFAYGGILLAVSLVFGVFIAFNTHREWQDNAGSFSRYLARAIALDVQDALLAHDIPRLMDKLTAISHTDLVSLACLHDLSGLVASYTKPRPGRVGPSCPPTQDLSVPGHIHALETVYADNTPIGYVTVHISSDMVAEQTFRRMLPILIALVAAVIVVLVATHWSNRRATRSLTTLTEYARTTSGASADFPRIDDAPEDIVELAEAFRRLVQHLVAAREEVSREAETRRVAEDAEQSSRELLRTIVNNVPHVVIVRRSDGSLLFSNRAAAALYGSTVEAMRQTEFLQTRTSPDGVLVPTSDFNRPQEVDFVDAEGVSHRLLVSRNSIDGTDYDLTLALDITEVHRLQVQLHFAQRLETVGTLAGGIAHDFNNLLTPILGYSTLLEAMDLPEDVRTRLGHITNAALKARNVVHQILTFSRQRPPSRRRVSIPALIQDVVSLMRATIPAHVLFRVNIRDQTIVDADPGQLEQVLVNLINNAAQAIGHETGEIHIDAWVETNEAGLIQAALRVSDSGAGMSTEVMSHIFEPFFTTKGVGEGSGLGLAVVHGIVQNHDGHIEVQSTPGIGTTFTLLLPAASAHPTTENDATHTTSA